MGVPLRRLERKGFSYACCRFRLVVKGRCRVLIGGEVGVVWCNCVAEDK